MRRLASEPVSAWLGWFEGHALRPKRAADDPSFALSRDLLVEGPQSSRGDAPERLPFAVWPRVRRDLGVQRAGDARARQVDAVAVGVPARGLLRIGWASGPLGARPQDASRSPTRNSYRTTGSNWRATGTALHSSQELRCCCNAPASRPNGPPQARHPLRVPDPNPARQQRGRGQRPSRNSTPISCRLAHVIEMESRLRRQVSKWSTLPLVCAAPDSPSRRAGGDGLAVRFASGSRRTSTPSAPRSAAGRRR